MCTNARRQEKPAARRRGSDDRLRADASGEAWAESTLNAYYPANAKAIVESRARKRFSDKVEEYGPGRSWRSEPPAAMLVQASAKIARAERHVEAGRPEEAVTAMADAVNYIRFEVDARMHGAPEERDSDA